MKTNVVKEMQENLLARDLKLSQTEVREVFKALEDTIVTTGKGLDVGEGVTLGCLSVKKKDVPERKGVAKMQEGKETEWVVPAHTEVDVKLRKVVRDKLKEF